MADGDIIYLTHLRTLIDEEVHQAVGDEMIGLTKSLVANLYLTNPVETGHSRGNWIPSIGPGNEEPYGSREAPSDVAQDAGLADVEANYRFTPAAPLTIQIPNAVEYITNLDEGSSSQAPAGWVEMAIEQAMNTEFGGGSGFGGGG